MAQRKISTSSSITEPQRKFSVEKKTSSFDQPSTISQSEIHEEVFEPRPDDTNSKPNDST